jgi:hypothetical protein
MVLCGSGLRPPGGHSGGINALIRLASESGCQGIQIGRGCLLPQAAPLLAEATRAGLVVGAIFGPLPETRLSPGKRLPRLAATEASERTAAVTLMSQPLELAGATGVGIVGVDAGPVALAVSQGEIATFFRRRELEEDEPKHARLQAALAERKSVGPPLLDALRRSLDVLLRQSERRGVLIAVELAATPWQVPTPREALELLAHYRGAPFGVALDPAKLSVMRTLGLPISSERLDALEGAALVVMANEAVGMDPGYLPGLGEPDLPARPFPAGKPIVLEGAGESTDAEVAAAVRAVG